MVKAIKITRKQENIKDKNHKPIALAIVEFNMRNYTFAMQLVNEFREFLDAEVIDATNPRKDFETELIDTVNMQTIGNPTDMSMSIDISMRELRDLMKNDAYKSTSAKRSSETKASLWAVLAKRKRQAEKFSEMESKFWNYFYEITEKQLNI